MVWWRPTGGYHDTAQASRRGIQDAGGGRGHRGPQDGQRVNEIASAYEIHPSQVGKWKSQALARLPEVLSDGRQVKVDGDPQREARLYEEIGRLRMEVEYLKKKLGLCPSSSVEG